MEFHIFTQLYLINFWQHDVENLGMYSWFSDFALVFHSCTTASGLKRVER